MKSILWVAIGGALGSVLRYLISIGLKQSYTYSFPWHTFFINIIGCIAIGVVYALLNNYSAPLFWQSLIVAGFLGGFTTFSSFGYETFVLFKSQQYVNAIVYMIGSNLFGLAGVFIGYQTINRMLA